MYTHKAICIQNYFWNALEDQEDDLLDKAFALQAG